MAESSSITPLRVFLSYSSEQTNIAEQVYFSLKSSGHDVFFDRTNLRPGEEYNRAILDRIRSSDLFVFLISPSSIQDSAYTRTEMRFARDTWPNPEGRVLPVLAVPTDFSQIPNYLKAVTILRPDGNLPAEVSASVNDLAAGRTPQDTIAGKAELIAKVAIATEQLQRSGRATAIDKQWDIDRKKLFATKESETPKGLAILVAFGIILALIIFHIMLPLLFSLYTSYTLHEPLSEVLGWEGSIPSLVLILVSLITLPLILRLVFSKMSEKTNRWASAYREAEQLYHSRRREALGEKEDKLPVNRGVGMEEASIIRQRLAAGETWETLAEEYQIQVSTVRYIEKNRMYEDA